MAKYQLISSIFDESGARLPATHVVLSLDGFINTGQVFDVAALVGSPTVINLDTGAQWDRDASGEWTQTK